MSPSDDVFLFVQICNKKIVWVNSKAVCDNIGIDSEFIPTLRHSEVLDGVPVVATDLHVFPDAMAVRAVHIVVVQILPVDSAVGSFGIQKDAIFECSLTCVFE